MDLYADDSTRVPSAGMTHRGLARVQTLAVITLIAAAITISRRIDMFTNPQFFAEDGARWFADAYNYGAFRALTFALAGYYQVVSRLGPVIAAPFGIANEPLVYNICGLIVQIAPIVFFLGPRYDTVASLKTRLVLSSVYLLMPADTLDITITTAPFHLAILATLVLIAPAPTRWYWKAFDVSVAVLFGLSGPFVYILFPVSVLWFVVRRQGFTLVLIAIFALTFGAQLYANTLSPRPDLSPGASLQSLLFIICDRIILAGLFGEPAHTLVYLFGRPHGTLLAATVCLLALPVVVYAAIKAPWELKMFALVALGIAAAGLVSPLVTTTGSQWLDMATNDGAGQRYFFMAEVAWVVTILWAASRIPNVWIRRSAWGLSAAAFVSGAVIAWTYAPFAEYHWAQEARVIASAPRGTRLVLPISPGGTWTVLIIKK